MGMRTNYFIDIGMLATFLVCGVTGILKIPELGLTFGGETLALLSLLHDWTGVVGIALAAVHTALHAAWLRRAAGGIFRKRGAAGGKNAAVRTKAAKGAAAVALGLLFIPTAADAWGGRGRHLSNASVPAGIDYAPGSLRDGTYSGTADGYNPELTVEVVVKDGSIGSIKIVEHNETPRWFLRVVTSIPNHILNAQSTDIDAVSGATDSSRGIMAAVEDALGKAKK